MPIPPPTPAPPSPEERRLYYCSLFPTCPPLVARSSTFVWENPQMPGSVMYPSHMSFCRKDGILAHLWESRRSGLTERIMEATEEVYNTIDIYRVYINGKFHETLMITVNPGLLSWERGYAIAIRCKTVLQDYGILHVHCEIRESVVVLS